MWKNCNKKKKHKKIVMLDRSKLMNNDISHEDLMAIINEEKNIES